jgi:hypothetical protein
VYSRFGLICELLEQTIQIMMTGQVGKSRQKMWRSIAIPGYFAVRGNGAMADRSFDHTATPTFRAYLNQMGRPSVKEARRLLRLWEKGSLPALLRPQAQRVAMSFLGFLEDAYGRGALAAWLRALRTPSQTIPKSLVFVFGKTEAELWREWYTYYYVDQWRRIVRGVAPLRSLPQPR